MEAWLQLFPSGERIMINIMLAAIYLAIVWIVAPAATATDELLLKVVYSVVPFLAYPIIFCAKFFQTPAKMEAATKDLVAQLKSRLDKREKEIKALAEDRPIFAGRIEQLIYSPSVDFAPDCFGCFALVTIINVGSRPSIATRFSFMMKKSGKWSSGNTRFVENHTLHFTDDIHPIILSSDDYIIRKLSTPIPPGGMEQGYLVGLFPREEFPDSGEPCLFTIEFEDYQGNLFKIELDQSNFRRSPGLMYLPRMKPKLAQED